MASSALTPMQMGMLYDSMQADLPGSNVEQLVCHFDDEAPDAERMVLVWQRLADRHPILRCVCSWRDGGEPHLHCLDLVRIPLPVDQQTDLSEGARDDWIAQWLVQDRAQGIKIDQGPTWRLNMMVWGDRSFTLVWTFHHLFLDGPSFAFLLQSALQDYLGQPSESVKIDGDWQAPTYTEHARAVVRWRSDPAKAEAARTFFRQMFNGVLLPTAEDWADVLPRPLSKAPSDAPLEKSRMALHVTQISAGTVAQLGSLCRATETTLASVVLSAWGLVLSRWTGRSDVLFGVVRSGRHLLPGSSNTLGCLINAVPVRVSLRRGMTLQQLLVNIRGTLLGLQPHEHTALPDIRSWCDFESTAALMNSTLLFEPRPLQRRLSDGLTSRARVELYEQGSSELSLMAYVDDGIDLRLEFDSSRIASCMAHQLLSSTREVLESMAASLPHSPLASVNACRDQDAELLSQWARPKHPIGTVSSCVSTQFEQRARATPDARALSFATDGKGLSFAQLNTMATGLAGWMMARGVKPGDCIALCLPRGASFVAAMLGVMKSGAAWVPVDPGYPTELIQHMVSDSQALMLLTDRAKRPDVHGVEIVVLEDIADQLEMPAVDLSARVWPVDRPAYVIYTSGSTGKPKGVLISHRALASHAHSVVMSYGLQPEDRVLQFSSLIFDVSIEEIVPTLLAGAELVLRTTEAAESVSAFLQLVAERKITVLNLPTAFWHTCVEQMDLSGAVLPEAVRLMVVGGEKASRAMLKRWRHIQPRVRWINAYGPTEATISSTYFDLTVGLPLPPGPDVPIGTPLGHSLIAVLAIDGSLAPPGARGELCIGGSGVADGYLGLPDVTAERFVSAQTWVDPQLLRWGFTRLYCTGDDARWDACGLLRYLGRKDRQVQVRGFRIELSAVEHAVEQIEGVAECVASVDRPNEAQARLLAWVLPQPGFQLTERDLETALASALPVHMRPIIKVVSTWPTTPGGKIDVRRLPAHGPTDEPAAQKRYLSEAVLQMTRLFARILGRESVGPSDSFFDLGGHSLLAVSLIATIEREHGRKLSVGTFKANPTPAALTAVLTLEKGLDGPQFLVVIQPGGLGIPIYGVHSLGEREGFYRPLAARLGPKQPLFGLTTGYTHLHESDLSVEQLAQFYSEDIQKHQPQGPLVLAALSMCGYVAFELARQLTEADREVAYLVLFDSEGPDGRPPLHDRSRILALHWQRLRKQGPRYLLERLVAELTASGGICSRLVLSLSRRLGWAQDRLYVPPADDAFVQKLERAVNLFTPKTYGGNIVIFYPEDELFFDLKEATRTGLGWRNCTTGHIDLVQVPGAHISMLAEPHVGQLAQQISKLIGDRILEEPTQFQAK